MRIKQISQHNAKFWIADDVSADFSVEWFNSTDTCNHGSDGRLESGRQGVLHLTRMGVPMIMRHYYRGGVPALFSKDLFLFHGFDKSRAYLELSLLENMWEAGLPVPKPVAARCQRTGLLYRADIIMNEILNSKTLVEVLIGDEPDEAMWENIGRTIRRFHEHGVRHVDLNANNILIDSDNNVYLIDFDRCYRKSVPKLGSLQRLRRSLNKEKVKYPEMHFCVQKFEILQQGYDL